MSGLLMGAGWVQDDTSAGERPGGGFAAGPDLDDATSASLTGVASL